MEINEDDISNLSKKIKNNLDEIKIILTFTESVEAYYQTENNKSSEYSHEIDKDEVDSSDFYFDELDEDKKIYEGEVLIIDKL